MKEDIKEILITEEELKEKVQELGKILTKDYKDKNPLCRCKADFLLLYRAAYGSLLVENHKKLDFCTYRR